MPLLSGEGLFWRKLYLKLQEREEYLQNRTADPDCVEKVLTCEVWLKAFIKANMGYIYADREKGDLNGEVT